MEAKEKLSEQQRQPILWDEANEAYWMYQLRFYVDALVHGELEVLPGKERTRQKSRCDICSKPQPSGMWKFWYRPACYYFHPCFDCMKKIIDRLGEMIEQSRKEVDGIRY